MLRWFLCRASSSLSSFLPFQVGVFLLLLLTTPFCYCPPTSHIYLDFNQSVQLQAETFDLFNMESTVGTGRSCRWEVRQQVTEGGNQISDAERSIFYWQSTMCFCFFKFLKWKTISSICNNGQYYAVLTPVMSTAVAAKCKKLASITLEAFHQHSGKHRKSLGKIKRQVYAKT